MPRLSQTGSALTGVAGGVTAIDGSTPTALVGSTGGGWAWLNDTTIIGQAQIPSLSAAWQFYQLTPLNAAAATLVLAEGANSVAAGGGVWQKWLGTNGIKTNVVAVPSLPSAGIGAVDWDGTWAVQTLYSSASGITVYAKIGTVLNQLPVSLSASHAPYPIAFRDGMLAYPTLQGWQLTDAESGSPVDGYVPQIGTTVLIPIVAEGQAVVVEYNAPKSQWTIRKANSGTGLVIATGSSTMFNVDAIYLGNNNFRVAWSTGQGEAPAELVVMDLNIRDGTTEVATVVGGVLVFATGPTLNGERFGMASGTNVYLPSKQEFVDKNRIITNVWLRALQQLDGAVAGNASSISGLNPPSPSATTTLSAEALLATGNPGLPQGRVVADSASVTWDFSAPGVATATAVSGGNPFDQDLNTFDDVEFNSLTIGLAAPPEANAQLQLRENSAPVAQPTSWQAQLLITQDDLVSMGWSVVNTNYSTDVYAGIVCYQTDTGVGALACDSEAMALYFNLPAPGQLSINTAAGALVGQLNTAMALTLTTPDTNDAAYDATPLAAIYINGPGSPSTRNFVSGIWCVTEANAVDKGRGIAVQNLGASDSFYAQQEAASAAGYAALNLAANVGIISENRAAGAIATLLRQGTGGGASVLLEMEADIAGTAELMQINSSQTGKSGIVVRASGAANKAFTVYNATPAIAFDVGADDGHIYTRTYIEGVEMTAPSAPGANGFRIFARDTGGKTELVVLFNSGVAQPIAIEP